MKFLIDNALSPFLSDFLKELGFDAVHVREIGIQKADDHHIFNTAFQQNRVIISADTDFSLILSNWKTAKPSIILFRKGVEEILFNRQNS